MIPCQLQDYYFCKVYDASKRPVGEAWNTKPYTYDQIQEWFKQGHVNYGIIAGYNNLVTIDFDNEGFYRSVVNRLPDSLTIKTPKRGYHIYFQCPDLKLLKEISDGSFNLEENGLHLGEVRFSQVMTLGPGSIHPETKTEYEIYQNVPIALITAEQILGVFDGLFARKQTKKTEASFEKLLSGIALTRQGNELIGAHPVHGSSTGTNFSVNPQKGVWCCRRHSTGGDWLYLTAVREGIIDCSQAVPGGLRGDAFVRTIAVAKEKYGLDYEEGIKWDYTKDGGLRRTLANVLNFFKIDSDLRDLFCFNSFSERIEFLRPPLWDKVIPRGKNIDDNDIVKLKSYLSVVRRFDVSKDLILEAVIVVAHKRAYHPIKSYLEGLKWDGVARIEHWLIDYAGAEDNPYVRQVSAKCLVAAVKRIYCPGHKFDYVTILEGEQGQGKSRMMAVLGGEWYLEAGIYDRDKDMVGLMAGKWIIEFSELAGFSRKDVEALKAFISRQVDTVRLPYERIARDFPRLCVFFGTINPDGDNTYFKDVTGNRRFWPVQCRRADWQGLSAVRDQLFAEAMALAQGDFTFYLTDEALEIAADEQKDRLVVDPWAGEISDFLTAKQEITITEIAAECLKMPLERVDRAVQIRVGRVLKEVGWVAVGRRERLVDGQRQVTRVYRKGEARPW